MQPIKDVSSITFNDVPYISSSDNAYYANKFFKKYLKRLKDCEEWLKTINPIQFDQYLAGNTATNYDPVKGLLECNAQNEIMIYKIDEELCQLLAAKSKLCSNQLTEETDIL